ncbi:MAG: hypothetical protein KatS3mg051_1772 [Anaerolineae bacterium]|nr:MAG: hypothetical protein KatS3mg051_1772 [Anaerolineae bacterium]
MELPKEPEEPCARLRELHKNERARILKSFTVVLRPTLDDERYANRRASTCTGRSRRWSARTAGSWREAIGDKTPECDTQRLLNSANWDEDRGAR